MNEEQRIRMKQKFADAGEQSALRKTNVSGSFPGNVYIVFYYEKQFFNFKETKPPVGVEVMAHSKSWIHEDYNKKGIRVGFLNEDENGEFISAKWDNSGDTYENCEEDKPDVWWYF
jgi:hypothetical protein